MNKTRVDLVAAARPNFMKVAPLYHALKATSWCDVRLVHTGQHYDANMSDSFFADFSLPAPDVHLEVGSGPHGEQTGKVMAAYEQVCLATPPDWVIVVGDVNSTLACALAAVKLGIRVAHLEAGLRSRDRSMPEEINRLATDAIADLLWTPSQDGNDNLLAEGVPPEKIEFVGNIMLDAFEMVRDKIAEADVARRLGLDGEPFGVVTLHRPSNVDDPAVLEVLVTQLVQASRKLPLIFAVHPRTRARLESTSLMKRLEAAEEIHLIDPLGYIEFMGLITRACVVITDSGGMQEETTYLGIPCLTLRANTERPITVNEGTNRLVQSNGLLDALAVALNVGRSRQEPPELWDGRAASRIVSSLQRHADAD